jgi:DNA-binding NarL/FixJ family response regulator
MNRPRVLLADDHTMFMEGLKGLLQDDFELLETVENGAALVESAARLEPDIIILDISMPVLNGFDAARELRKRGTSAKIIFLTMHADTGLVAEAVRCGASGYVVKHSAGKDLISAIRQVFEGKNYFPNFVTSDLNTHSLNLTPRQRDVLRLIAQGLTMKEAASELGISTRTAESHKYEMMEALGVETTADLIKYAIKLGFISV